MSKREVVDEIDRSPEYDAFMARLENHHERKGTSLLREPTIGGRRIDLLLAYKRVIDAGGFESVTQDKAWKALSYREMLVPLSFTNAPFVLKAMYQKQLFSFELEEYWEKLPIKVRGERDGEWEEQRVGSGGILGAGKLLAERAALEEAAAANFDAPQLLVPQPFVAPPKHQQHLLELSFSDPPVDSRLDEDSDLGSLLKLLSAPNEHNRLLLALRSNLPNEIDWAFNALIKLSYSSDAFVFDRIPGLLDLLLQHLRSAARNTNMLRILCESNPATLTTAEAATHFVEGPRTYKRMWQTERVLQALHILRNVSFLAANHDAMIKESSGVLSVIRGGLWLLRESIKESPSLEPEDCVSEVGRLALDVLENISVSTALWRPSTNSAKRPASQPKAPLKRLESLREDSVAPSSRASSEPLDASETASLAAVLDMEDVEVEKGFMDPMLAILTDILLMPSTQADHYLLSSTLRILTRLTYTASNVPQVSQVATEIFRRVVDPLLVLCMSVTFDAGTLASADNVDDAGNGGDQLRASAELSATVLEWVYQWSGVLLADALSSELSGDTLMTGHRDDDGNLESLGELRGLIESITRAMIGILELAASSTVDEDDGQTEEEAWLKELRQRCGGHTEQAASKKVEQPTTDAAATVDLQAAQSIMSLVEQQIVELQALEQLRAWLYSSFTPQHGQSMDVGVLYIEYVNMVKRLQAFAAVKSAAEPDSAKLVVEDPFAANKFLEQVKDVQPSARYEPYKTEDGRVLVNVRNIGHLRDQQQQLSRYMEHRRKESREPSYCLWQDCTEKRVTNVANLEAHLREFHVKSGKYEYQCFWHGCGTIIQRPAAFRRMVAHLRGHVFDIGRLTLAEVTTSLSKKHETDAAAVIPSARIVEDEGAGSYLREDAKTILHSHRITACLVLRNLARMREIRPWLSRRYEMRLVGLMVCLGSEAGADGGGFELAGRLGRVLELLLVGNK